MEKGTKLQSWQAEGDGLLTEMNDIYCDQIAPCRGLSMDQGTV